VRLVQRHGRIDALLSNHKRVFLRTFFPGVALDSQLDLEGRVRRKSAPACDSSSVKKAPSDSCLKPLRSRPMAPGSLRGRVFGWLGISTRIPAISSQMLGSFHTGPTSQFCDTNPRCSAGKITGYTAPPDCEPLALSFARAACWRSGLRVRIAPAEDHAITCGSAPGCTLDSVSRVQSD
jgi:hypothetical protein